MSNPDIQTNGRRRTLLDSLEARVRDAIDRSIYTGDRHPNGSPVMVDHDDERAALRDYARNHAMFDKFDDLIARETQGERQHRRGAPNGWRFKFGPRHGARIVLLNNIGDGARLTAPPSATSFISMRSTAAEAMLVGWLARAALRADPGLLDALALLDYAQAGRD